MSEKLHWSRWILASVSKHFDANVNLTMFVEGDPRSTKDAVDFFELRLGGPDIRLLNPNYWKLEVNINILLQSTIDDTDTHKLQKKVGMIIEAFTTSINVYRYGARTLGDDETLLGCMVITDEPLDIKHFGQLEPRLKVQQSSIEGNYELFIRGA